MQKERRLWLLAGFLGLFSLVFAVLWIAYPPEHSKPTGVEVYPKLPEFMAWKVNPGTNSSESKKQIESKQILGSWSLLHLWATWCEPCVEEFPLFIEMARKYEKSAVKFVALSMDEKADDVWKLVPAGKELPQNMTMLWDEKKEIPDLLGSFQYPETYLISPSGDIKYKWVGPQKWLGPTHRQILEQSGVFSQGQP